MEKTELANGYYQYYRPGVLKMRLVLIICAILYTYGSHTALTSANGVIFGFSFPALYIFSGYLVLRKSQNIEKRIIRAISRAAVCFLIMFATSVVLSLVANTSGTIKLLANRAFWLNLLILNKSYLPIGSVMWSVQALLYAYIIIYFIYKLDLLHLDIYIAIICLIFTVASGELSSVLDFKIRSFTYIGGNFLTRALPYVLIGCFIHRKKGFFYRLDTAWYYAIIAVGIVFSIVEYCALFLTDNLRYTGHTVGSGLVAVGICLLTVFMSEAEIQSELLNPLSRYEIMLPFFVSSPIYYFLLWFFANHHSEVMDKVSDFTGILTVILSVLALYVYSVFRKYVLKSEN